MDNIILYIVHVMHDNGYNVYNIMGIMYNVYNTLYGTVTLYLGSMIGREHCSIYCTC